jgi:copper chaperone
MSKKHFNVSNLTNEVCKTQVKNALDKVEGVQKVSVSLGLGTIEVDYNEPATEGKIVNCIEDTGFEVE